MHSLHFNSISYWSTFSTTRCPFIAGRRGRRPLQNKFCKGFAPLFTFYFFRRGGVPSPPVHSGGRRDPPLQFLINYAAGIIAASVKGFNSLKLFQTNTFAVKPSFARVTASVSAVFSAPEAIENASEILAVTSSVPS